MTNKTHWLQRNKKKNSKQEDEKAKQAIYAMAEEARKKVEARQEKIRIAQERRYGDK